ncbi:MAG TPA: MFS transporter, partial [Hanamia sp.]|nr:MFS transporter [Hanamia sp.]
VTTFSWLSSISGLGALIGAGYLATLKTAKKLLKIIVIAGLLLSANLVLFSYTSNFPLALLFLMIAESGLLTIISASNTYIQTHVEEHMRGRVISYFVMAFSGMQPIGSLIIGSLAHITNAPLTVLLEGIAGIIIIVLFIPAFKKTNEREERKEKRLRVIKM